MLATVVIKNVDMVGIPYKRKHMMKKTGYHYRQRTLSSSSLLFSVCLWSCVTHTTHTHKNRATTPGIEEEEEAGAYTTIAPRRLTTPKYEGLATTEDAEAGIPERDSIAQE